MKRATNFLIMFLITMCFIGLLSNITMAAEGEPSFFKIMLESLFTWQNILTLAIAILGIIATIKYKGLANAIIALLEEYKQAIDPESEKGKEISAKEKEKIIKRIGDVLKEIVSMLWKPFFFRFTKLFKK